jgi:CheY-like chemotaxis protein
VSVAVGPKLNIRELRVSGTQEYQDGQVAELAQLLHSLFETTERLPFGPERIFAFRKVDDFRERIMAMIRRSEIKAGTDEGSLDGYRVLIVEDEYFVANDLERALKSRGASIIGPCSDFTDAHLRAARDHFDAAIVDINIRNKTAYPIADELMRQSIPFVFCTGYSASVIPKRFAGIGVWHKPFDTLALVAHIAQLCRHATN